MVWPSRIVRRLRLPTCSRLPTRRCIEQNRSAAIGSSTQRTNTPDTPQYFERMDTFRLDSGYLNRVPYQTILVVRNAMILKETSSGVRAIDLEPVPGRA
ncbi:hypothetical protein BLAT2472_20059 [Burkholderia latens]